MDLIEDPPLSSLVCDQTLVHIDLPQASSILLSMGREEAQRLQVHKTGGKEVCAKDQTDLWGLC